jgi:DNA replication protein DnaC
MTALKDKARKLGFRAIETNFDEYESAEWLPALLEAEERERDRRSFERRVREARIGNFKPMADFDWKWPAHIERDQIEELFRLEFLKDKANVILFGTNGLGKTMIAQNLAHTALMRGISTRFVKAGDMLNELVECDGSKARRNCLKKYCSVALLVIDEVGYLSYDNRFADLLYEVINGRYEKNSTVLTTNRAFSEWADIFPHAACVVTLVDRLTHRSESVLIKGKSYRENEAQARLKAKQQKRKPKDEKPTESATAE